MITTRIFLPAGATMGHDYEWAGRRDLPGGFDQTGDVTTRKAIQWLASHPRQKFFLWVHYFDPHAPYSPPEPFAKKFLKKQGSFLENVNAYYDGEILFVDQQMDKATAIPQEERYRFKNAHRRHG